MSRTLIFHSFASEKPRFEFRSLLISIALAASLCALESLYFNNGLVRSAQDAFFQSTDGFAVFFAYLYLAVSLFLLWSLIYLILCSRPMVKIVATLILIFAVFVEFSYLRAVGRFTIPFDITIAMTATSDQKTDSLLAFSSFAWVPFIVLLVACSFLPQTGRNIHSFRPMGIWVFFAMIYYVQLSFFAPLLSGQRLVSSSFDAFAQISADYFLTKPMELMSPPVRIKVLPAVESKELPTNNVVVIFDESIRGDHLSINGYKRQTTPFLEQLEKQNLLTNWGVAVSSSTASHPSYDAFITGATPELLAVRPQSEINQMPTIFQYAKAMNYKTHLLDGQMKYYWGGIKDDVNYVDSLVTLNDIDPGRIEDYERRGEIKLSEDDRDGMKQWEIDAKLAKIVQEIFAGSTGNFIFVYKRGVHFPYEKNFPKDEMRWAPIYYFKNQWEVPPGDAHDAIVNSYDNSIAYNLDDFFEILLQGQQTLPNKTTIIYTSDHGESFYAGGKAGHGGDTKEEALVPLFTLGLDRNSVDSKFPASHSNIFTTLLDLVGYPNQYRGYPYAVSLLKAKRNDARPRSFNLADGKRIAFD